MRILVFNAGSSSLKFSIFDMNIKNSRVFKGEFEHFKNGKCLLRYRVSGEAVEEKQRNEYLSTIENAILRVPDILKEFNYSNFDAIGHRVAHRGELFYNATLIDDTIIKKIEDCIPLAPLHNPANLKAINISRKLWPDLPQVAVEAMICEK